MDGKQGAEILLREQKYLMNIIGSFKPEHGHFVPAPGMMSVAQQIHHIAFTVKWFREGAFGAGFNMDFEMLEAENKKTLSLDSAIKELNETYADYAAFLETLSEADLLAPMPPNPIFGEAPKVAVLNAGGDHTAHHRGALSVYLRLLGITPVMIYTE